MLNLRADIRQSRGELKTSKYSLALPKNHTIRRAEVICFLWSDRVRPHRRTEGLGREAGCDSPRKWFRARATKQSRRFNMAGGFAVCRAAPGVHPAKARRIAGNIARLPER